MQGHKEFVVIEYMFTDRSYLRITEQEFTTLPIDVSNYIILCNLFIYIYI